MLDDEMRKMRVLKFYAPPSGLSNVSVAIHFGVPGDRFNKVIWELSERKPIAVVAVRTASVGLLRLGTDSTYYTREYEFPSALPERDRYFEVRFTHRYSKRLKLWKGLDLHLDQVWAGDSKAGNPAEWMVETNNRYAIDCECGDELCEKSQWSVYGKSCGGHRIISRGV